MRTVCAIVILRTVPCNTCLGTCVQHDIEEDGDPRLAVPFEGTNVYVPTGGQRASGAPSKFSFVIKVSTGPVRLCIVRDTCGQCLGFPHYHRHV